MKTYPYQDGGRLIQLVEKRELDQLLDRLAEARDSHLHASARDVQTIQRQAIMLERLAGALETLVKQAEYHNAVGVYWDEAHSASAAYQSANLEPVANPIGEAVRRMEEVPMYELDEIWFERTGLEWDFDAAMERIRTRLISAAKGKQP
jgi:hypothetical protein